MSPQEEREKRRNKIGKELVQIAEEMASNGTHLADLKLVKKAMEELCTGFKVFAPFKKRPKVSFFGSARTKEGDKSYDQTKACAKKMADAGWMTITGGGPGAMQAANEGAGYENSFGVNISLPAEQNSNHVINGTDHEFDCNYFFTRKVFFLKESHAVVLTPGGFGTLDEAFETLTLLQTGRNDPIPVVLLEEPGGDFWGPFIYSWIRRLTDGGMINPEDRELVFHTDNINDAVEHITSFYNTYHSFRYAGKYAVLRINKKMGEKELSVLNAEFSDILAGGEIQQREGWPRDEVGEVANLPRLTMEIERSKINCLVQIIRRINQLGKRLG